MSEIHEIVEIQRAAWGMDDLGIVPTFEMKAVASVGTVLVAVNTNDIIVGFIYAFDQLPDSHYSHMMAVIPSWQGKSVGYELKKTHRMLALQENIRHIRWTVDPLLPNNAFLNFAKLGAVCGKYYDNYYGDPEVEGIDLYAGLETDRFLIDWQIDTDKVARRMDDYTVDRVSQEELIHRSSPINTIENDHPKFEDDYLEKDQRFLVQVPNNFQQLRADNLELAKLWRNFFREICQHYFSKGFQVIDYHSFNRVLNYYEFDKI